MFAEGREGHGTEVHACKAVAIDVAWPSCSSLPLSPFNLSFLISLWHTMLRSSSINLAFLSPLHCPAPNFPAITALLLVS